MAVLLFRKQPQLEKWLGTKELSWLRLAAAEPGKRQRVAQLAAQLDLWERRLLDLAEFFDSLDVAPLDRLLLQVFRYGYFRGLARASYGEGTARRVCAALYLDAVPAAARAFGKEMRRLGLPYPRADQQAIAGLV